MLNSDFTLSQAMYECRAMRRLKADPVRDEVLIDLIDAANQAASGSNAQMARWIVVKDPAQKESLLISISFTENPISRQMRRTRETTSNADYSTQSSGRWTTCMRYPHSLLPAMTMKPELTGLRFTESGISLARNSESIVNRSRHGPWRRHQRLWPCAIKIWSGMRWGFRKVLQRCVCFPLAIPWDDLGL